MKRAKIDEENRYLLRLQHDFRRAADIVTDALMAFEEVEAVAVIGSVAKPLWQEIPRFSEFRRAGIEVWHEWLFCPAGIQHRQPKWVTTTNTQPYLPAQATSIPNLVLAGAHTRTAADVWSIEGAVESGRRAAQVIEPSVRVIPQYKPLWLRVLGAVDDVCFAIGAPHVLDLFLAGSLTALIILVAIVISIR